MNRNSILVVLMFLFGVIAVAGQVRPAPAGASNFIRASGGLDFTQTKPDLIEHIAGDNFDGIEAGGAAPDWTEVKGRVFLTRRWMVEISKIKETYSTFDFEKQLAASFQKQLESEGFKVKAAQSKLGPLSYQRGMTVGTLDVFAFFLGSGNPPYRMEFIFHESYLRKRRSSSR